MEKLTPATGLQEYDLLGRLDLTISSKNLIPPSTKVTCLGIEIDIMVGSVSIPEEELQKN